MIFVEFSADGREIVGNDAINKLPAVFTLVYPVESLLFCLLANFVSEYLVHFDGLGWVWGLTWVQLNFLLLFEFFEYFVINFTKNEDCDSL